MPWKECSVMDERMQFVARRLGDGGALQGVWDLSKDGLQDLRSLSAMRHSGADRPQPASLPLRQSTSVSGRELHHELKHEHPSWGARKIRERLLRQVFTGC